MEHEPTVNVSACERDGSPSGRYATNRSLCATRDVYIRLVACFARLSCNSLGPSVFIVRTDHAPISVIRPFFFAM